MPRVYERFYIELNRWLLRRPRFVRRLVAFTITLGESVFEREQGRSRRRARHLLWPFLRYFVARRCLRLFGADMQYAVSGAAALPYPVARTLVGLGVPVLQGYGLTEATGIEVESWPRLVANVAPRFPKATFVCGHSGNCPPMRRMAIDAALANENVYLETCSTFRSPGAIEQLVEEAGPERVLFGSDLPLMDPRSQLGKIITADISDDAKRLVLGENARRILKLP